MAASERDYCSGAYTRPEIGKEVAKTITVAFGFIALTLDAYAMRQ